MQQRDNEIEEIKIDDEHITFNRHGIQTYWIGRVMVEAAGVDFWIDHLNDKSWFSGGRDTQVRKLIKEQWGIK